MAYEIQQISRTDREIIGAMVRKEWGDEKIIVHEETFHTAELSGLKAVENSQILGFLHYQVRDDLCEILTLASLRKRQGIGLALIQAIEGIARSQGCRMLKATTTNDNLGALVFYQRCGFVIMGLGIGFVDDARKLKSTIPEIGNFNIPIHDEIYLEKSLSQS